MGGFVSIQIVTHAMGRLLLPLDQTEEVWLTAAEVRMLEVPRLRVRLAHKYTLLQMGNLVEAIHVELPDKGSELLVLEPPPKYLSGEAFMVEHYRGETRLGPGQYNSITARHTVKRVPIFRPPNKLIVPRIVDDSTCYSD